MDKVQLFLLIFSVVSCDYLETTYISFFGMLIIPMKINNDPNETFFESINQETTFTWTSDPYYSPQSDMNSCKVVRSGYITTIDDNEFDTTEYVTQANVTNNAELDPFYFLSLIKKDGISYVESGHAFAMKFKDIKYSIVHQLYNKHLITKLSYAIVPETIGYGSLYYGNIPNEHIENKHSFTCKSDPHYTSWGCQLSHVFIGDISYIYENIYYENNAQMLFQASEEKILAPYDFMDFLNDYLFATKIKQSICSRVLEGILTYFSCDCGKLDKFEQLRFIFEGVAVKVDPKELFKEIGGNCEFLIVHADLGIKGKRWKFGTAFLSLMITEYDYEKESITFYSVNNYERINMATLFPSSRIWTVLCIMLFLGLGMLLGIFGYRRFKKRKQSITIALDYKNLNNF